MLFGFIRIDLAMSNDLLGTLHRQGFLALFGAPVEVAAPAAVAARPSDQNSMYKRLVHERVKVLEPHERAILTELREALFERHAGLKGKLPPRFRSETVMHPDNCSWRRSLRGQPRYSLTCCCISNEHVLSSASTFNCRAAVR